MCWVGWEGWEGCGSRITACAEKLGDADLLLAGLGVVAVRLYVGFLVKDIFWVGG